ncbi:MAG: helix-turn-helix transcriptional regulator [Polyangiaceae bacterium]|nr:helix-turn-helix transcriptional regulator [Polyangiaceae bacterium]
MGGKTTVGISTSVDWPKVIEAVYSPSSDDAAWSAHVLATAHRALRIDASPGLVVHRHAPDLSSWEHLFHEAPMSREHTTRAHVEMINALGLEGMREMYYPASLVTTHLDIARRLSRAGRDYMRQYRAAFGALDVLGLVVHPEPGVVAVLFFGSQREFALPRAARATLSRLALHVEAGLRLRLRPESIKAVIDTRGKVEHHTPGAPRPDKLSSYVQRIESTKQRAASDALELWTALVDGRVTLVPRTEGSRRFYLVLENAPATQPIRALTPREIDVLSQAARGLPGKLISYALGISGTAVSAQLGSAASKVGLATRIELVRIAAMLARDPRARFEALALTTAERDVLQLLTHGLSNREIARMRGRSMRTIANQVARLLEKTDSPGRRALVARVP